MPGQVGANADGVIVDPNDFRALTEDALENIQRVIESAEGTKQETVTSAPFLTDVKYFPASTSAVVKGGSVDHYSI